MKTLLLLIYIALLTSLYATPLGRVNHLLLTLPLDMDINTFIQNSLGHAPKALIKDGLPFFGAKRGDFLGKVRKHKGLDIYGNHQSIYASADGYVKELAHGKRSGIYIKLQHKKDIQTLYIHLTSVCVKKGDHVLKGEKLGDIDGPAGNAVAAQLHYEIKVHGVHKDPISYMKAYYHDSPIYDSIVQKERDIHRYIPLRNQLVKSYLKNH